MQEELRHLKKAQGPHGSKAIASSMLEAVPSPVTHMPPTPATTQIAVRLCSGQTVDLKVNPNCPMVAVAKMLRTKLHLKHDTQIDFYEPSGSYLQQHKLVLELNSKSVTAIISKAETQQFQKPAPQSAHSHSTESSLTKHANPDASMKTTKAATTTPARSSAKLTLNICARTEWTCRFETHKALPEE